MATMRVTHVVENSAGTQLKLFVTFSDASKAILKPMRFDRNKETNPNHFYFSDFERHNSEIAAFHLDRILGFRRCPPVVGRKPKIICFYGHCRSYCDTSHAICGRPDTVEASLAALLPPDALASRQRWRNPWRRSYRKRQKAAWEEDNNYCKVVRENSMYDNTKRLADIVDMAILDFLIGNMDRHHYETFKIFGNDSFILHLDQGRGFGRPNHDELSILAPLQQCCFLHFKTFHRLVELQHGDMKLSTLMRCSLYKDPLNPVLLDSHLKALDRRLEIVLQTIRKCILEIQPFFFPQSITEGDRVLGACTTKSGDKSGGQPSFKWSKDGKDLSTRTQVKTFGDFSTIVIDPVTEEDSGNYTCSVTSGGLHDSFTAQLTVMVPPQWISAPNDVNSFSGEFLVINCKASGKPIPKISWMKSEGKGIEGFVAIGESEMHRLPLNGSLVIESVRKSDEGIYQCLAANSVGQSVKKIISINVFGKKKFDLKSFVNN
ncbi:hypothetical protein TNCV_1434261 [Trichonephila clavipes]|nr:hypothetical protein TNCV_1434261 [Trichonephila clavipes]